MEILEVATERGVVERRFDLNVEGEIVPGIHWLPEGEAAPHPTVLIGHGGTQHKRVPNVLGLARTLVRHCGYGVVALDAPAHGDRLTEAQRQARAELFAARQDGRPVPASLGALGPDDDVRRAQAASITIPILFLFQSDDELMTRDGGLALWDAFGSGEKTMHLNPGPHVAIPPFERQAAVTFFRRHFEPGTPQAAPAP
jgi:pimeloyl-ACP methyl ester carboxylesterase